MHSFYNILAFDLVSNNHRHDITEILLKVVLNTIKQTNIIFNHHYHWWKYGL